MNIAVIAVISIISMILSRFFGVDMSGNSLMSLAIFSLVVGFSGAFISLLISRWSAKRAYSITLLDQTNIHLSSVKEQRVYSLIRELSFQNTITMPEVGVYVDLEVNAFATGRSKNASLVAVSTALLEQCTIDEIE